MGNNAFSYKTRSEQKADWLNAERAVRPLTQEEWLELGRAEHANYCRARRNRFLAAHEREEAELLETIQAESTLPDPGRYER